MEDSCFLLSTLFFVADIPIGSAFTKCFVVILALDQRKEEEARFIKDDLVGFNLPVRAGDDAEEDALSFFFRDK